MEDPRLPADSDFSKTTVSPGALVALAGTAILVFVLSARYALDWDGFVLTLVGVLTTGILHGLTSGYIRVMHSQLHEGLKWLVTAVLVSGVIFAFLWVVVDIIAPRMEVRGAATASPALQGPSG